MAELPLHKRITIILLYVMAFVGIGILLLWLNDVEIIALLYLELMLFVLIAFNELRIVGKRVRKSQRRRNRIRDRQELRRYEAE